ncbi:unnamed protein product [marine sediment metagenome]|uniref:Uncharacterized protein n=1 Tax=marine sediment metagenome TaxID=412755 RepID=X0W5S3_9ZZZZ
MEFEKLSKEGLLKQIKESKIGYKIFALGSLFFLVMGLFMENVSFIVIASMIWVATLYNKHQEMYDKIRLEIREIRR